tara:strand:+ start:2646 stop:2897 length:252 start_codon:yes stop_codon:yes gene_type:complete
MMETILLIISAGFLGAALFVFEPYMEFIGRYANVKPFNCVLCLTFWVCAVVFYGMGFPVHYSIISAVIAELTYRKLVTYGEDE